VIWKPSRLDYESLNKENAETKLTWLPYDVREVFDRSGSSVIRRRHHHVFVRPRGNPDVIYAGEAHLGFFGVGAYGVEESSRNREAHFSLEEKLPREIWLECGGFNGWYVEVNHKEHIVEREDSNLFNGLLAQLTNRGFSHLSMTRYEEDSLTIHTNPTRAWLMYLREPADGGLYANDPVLGDDEEYFECVCGISLEFPRCQTVSHDEAASIARHYFSTGNLPADANWS
jgi:hypothetical protein